MTRSSMHRNDVAARCCCVLHAVVKVKQVDSHEHDVLMGCPTEWVASNGCVKTAAKDLSSRDIDVLAACTCGILQTLCKLQRWCSTTDVLLRWL